MPEEKEYGLDGWSIGALRQQARPPRPDGLLLDDGRHADAHVRFVPNGTGYEIVEADGPPPSAGDEVEIAGTRFRVLRIGRSPFPADPRPCAYLY
jgi:hypothetical protein